MMVTRSAPPQQPLTKGIFSMFNSNVGGQEELVTVVVAAGPNARMTISESGLQL